MKYIEHDSLLAIAFPFKLINQLEVLNSSKYYRNNRNHNEDIRFANSELTKAKQQ